MTAAALAARLAAAETPPDVIAARLTIATRSAEQVAATEPVLAALVVGSTALRRCSATADLDVVLVTPSGDERFESRRVDGLRVELEWRSRPDVLDATAGTGWVYELRQAARLGCSAAVHDPDGLASQLAARAAGMHPTPARFEATLRDVYLTLIELARHPDPDRLRGCLDNLVLLALLVQPRRYQKAKWALADLLHAGEHTLVDAVLDAYGVASGHAHEAHRAVAAARDVVVSAYAAAGLPDHEAILALGHAPDIAAASYVSRCLDDAEDLLAGERFVEAQYVARFAARLAAGLLSAGGGGGDDTHDAPMTTDRGVVGTFATYGLDRAYLALFDGGPATAGTTTSPAVDIALTTADRLAAHAATSA